jgi:enoyl-CoA hydratase
MKTGLDPGITGELSERVSPDVSIALGDHPGVGVYSTPSMINLMEYAARAAVESFLEDGEETVGAGIDVKHLAPTPIGERVRAIARITSVEGRKIRFDIEAWDEIQQIGRGTHTRVSIKLDEFGEMVGRGRQPAPSPRQETGPGMYETIAFESMNGLGRLTLNRPRALNAINRQMTAELEDIAARLAEDNETRVVIVTGEGRAFCAGDDVKELADLPTPEAELLIIRQGRLFTRFHELPQVLIAAVNGPAMGGGAVLATACDLRVAGFAASFGWPEVTLGWPPGYGNADLIALVGIGRALELTLTGESIDAKRALDIGLVEKTVPQMVLMNSTETLAERILSLPPKAISETKTLLHRDRGLNPAESHIADAQAYLRCLETDDAHEGISAFVEKRAPKWKDR